MLTYGGHMAGGEVVFGEAKEHARFADGGVADDNQLDEVVVILLTPALVLVHFKSIIIFNQTRTRLKVGSRKTASSSL